MLCSLQSASSSQHARSSGVSAIATLCGQGTSASYNLDDRPCPMLAGFFQNRERHVGTVSLVCFECFAASADVRSPVTALFASLTSNAPVSLAVCGTTVVRILSSSSVTLSSSANANHPRCALFVRVVLCFLFASSRLLESRLVRCVVDPAIAVHMHSGSNLLKQIYAHAIMRHKLAQGGFLFFFRCTTQLRRLRWRSATFGSSLPTPEQKGNCLHNIRPLSPLLEALCTARCSVRVHLPTRAKCTPTFLTLPSCSGRA